MFKMKDKAFWGQSLILSGAGALSIDRLRSRKGGASGRPRDGAGTGPDPIR